MNRIPIDIVYLIYEYLHRYNFNIVLFDLKKVTSEMKDYVFDYTSDDHALHPSKVQRCFDCRKKWLYACLDDLGYKVCDICIMEWRRKNLKKYSE